MKECHPLVTQLRFTRQSFMDCLASVPDRSFMESIGTLLLRNIYHYWYHTGEAHTVRGLLGHSDLPEYVGNMPEAFYRPE
jgi:hypothetical protein